MYKMLNMIKNFVKNESGAVTVDWVVLTGAVVALGLLVMAAIVPAAQGLSNKIAATMDNTL